MSFDVTPNGTRGRGLPHPPALMARFYNGVFRRFGSRMKVAGRPLLLLTTTGAKSGKRREIVLGYWIDDGSTDGSLIVAATNAGAGRHPAWFLNLAANPSKAWIERPGPQIHVTAELLTGAERDTWWRKITDSSRTYASYNVKTDRQIPVVRLRPSPA